MLWVLIGVVLLLVWLIGLIDVFRRRDLSRGAKAAWALFIVLLPVIGIVVYLVVRPRDVTDTFHMDSPATVDNDERLRGTHPF